MKFIKYWNSSSSVGNVEIVTVIIILLKLMIEMQDRQTVEISIQADVWKGVCEKSRIQV